MKTKEQIDASANLLGDVINMFVRASYANWKNENLVGELKGGITKAAEQIEEATDKTKDIKKLLGELHVTINHLNQ